MNIALIFPPGWDPIQPYLSLPTLKSFLAQKSQNIQIYDLNVEFYDYLLSKENLSNIYQNIENTTHNNNFNNHQEINVFHKIKTSILSEIEYSKTVLRSDQFFDSMKRERALRTIDLGLQLQSFVYPQFEIALQWIKISKNKFNSTNINHFIANSNITPFSNWYQEKFLPRLMQLQPAIIGISLINYDQLIPTFLLAKEIKQIFPHIHIVIGGDIATRLSKTIIEHSTLNRYIDSVICHEGEQALLTLCQHFEEYGAFGLHNVPNLCFNDGKGKAQITPQAHPLPMASLPPPDFSGLPFDKYFAPHLVLPVESSRGCYWGKCTFCEEVGKSYRTKTAAGMINEINILKQKYNTKYFAFTDPCTSPKFIKEFSTGLLKTKEQVFWRTLSRAEQAFDKQTVQIAHQAGLRMVMIGIESGDIRISDLMEKGLTSTESLPVLQIFHNTGVWVHTFLMMGFPTETFEEAMNTIKFVQNGREFLDSVGMSEFVAPKNTPIFEQLSKMPITIHAQTSNPWMLHFNQFDGQVLNQMEKEQLWNIFIQQIKTLNTESNKWLQLHVNHLFLQIVVQGKKSLTKIDSINNPQYL